jgi:hypothetical protein
MIPFRLGSSLGEIVKVILATALLLGFSSFTAHAEWEILDAGTAVATDARAPAPTVTVATDPASSVTVSNVGTTK